MLWSGSYVCFGGYFLLPRRLVKFFLCGAEVRKHGSTEVRKVRKVQLALGLMPMTELPP